MHGSVPESHHPGAREGRGMNMTQRLSRPPAWLALAFAAWLLQATFFTWAWGWGKALPTTVEYILLLWLPALLAWMIRSGQITPACRLPRNRLLLAALGGLLLLLLAGALFSIKPSRSLALIALLLVLLFTFAIMSAEERTLRRSLVLFSFGILAMLAAQAALFAMTGQPILRGRLSIGWNAAVLSMIFFCTLPGFMLLERPWARAAFSLLAVIGILLTGTRGVFGATVVFFLLLFLAGGRQLVLRKALLRAGGMVLVFALVLVTLHHFWPRTAASDAFSRLAHVPRSLAMRNEAWTSALKVWWHHPLLGVGFGMHDWYLKKPDVTGLPMTYHYLPFYAHAHNQYLGMLADAGPAGLLAWLAALGSAIVFHGRRALASAAASPLAAVGFAFLSAYAFLSLFEATMFQSGRMVWFMAMLFILRAFCPRFGRAGEEGQT